jgi:alpha/beta superfamily hydrolase
LASSADPAAGGPVGSPVELLGVLASQEVAVADGLRHLELFTMQGLLTVLWHGPLEATHAVVACGGAMGGLLGPADGLYHDLGVRLGADGIALLRVGWRRPNDLGMCTIDLAAAVELTVRHGAERVVTMGHSFGGAIAVRTAVALPETVVGVVTLATQSAGCEAAEDLGERPFLLLHGDADELLPVAASEMVRLLAGHGELVVLHGAGHLLTQAGDELRERLTDWLPAVLAGSAAS